MPKTLCKALRKDGQPCQGLGQEQYGGYCIAHAPADKVWEWRSRGGQASSTAARADKRMPDRLRGVIEKVTKGMDDLAAGEIEPAALSAISRAARVLIDLNSLADAEMDQIREEETSAAAAQVAGGFGDPDLIEKADAIAAWQNQYRIDSLILQGLVTLERDESEDAQEALVPILTTAGRQRFRYQRLASHTQKEIDTWRNLATDSGRDEGTLPAALYHLYKMRLALEELLTDFAPGSPPALDPLSGQALSQLPDGVKPATVPVVGPEESEQVATNIQEQLRQANELYSEIEILYEREVGRPFDIQDELDEESY